MKEFLLRLIEKIKNGWSIRVKSAVALVLVIVFILSIFFATAVSQEAGRVRAGEDDKGTAAPVSLVAGSHQLDMADYTMVPLQSSQIEVSSYLNSNLGKDRLIQPGTAGYWHVEFPKQELRPWILVDLEIPQPVAVWAILNRPDVDQLWRGYRAVIEVSNDKNDWTTVARLGLVDETTTQQWTYFNLPDPQAYRYYRFSSHDWNFVSMARIALYVRLGTLEPLPAPARRPLEIRGTTELDISPYTRILLESSQIEVSSYNDPWSKEHLVKPGIDGFWHIQHPRETSEAWLLIDTGDPQPVSVIRVLPRENIPSQLWYGYTARLEASNDLTNWSSLATLGILEKELTGDWVSFLIGNLESFRYYRLTINDAYFFSMARIEIYRIE